MSRRPATITQADVARIFRAAKQAGVSVEVELSVGGQKVLVRIAPSTGEKIELEAPEDFRL